MNRLIVNKMSKQLWKNAHQTFPRSPKWSAQIASVVQNLKKKKKKDSSFTITSDKEKAANPYV